MKKEVELIRKLVSTVQLLNSLVDELDKHGHTHNALEQRCKCFGVELALSTVCNIYGIQAYGLEISDDDEQE